MRARLFAVILATCLTADPLLAFPVSQVDHRLTTSPSIEKFQQEAFSVRAIPFLQQPQQRWLFSAWTRLLFLNFAQDAPSPYRPSVNVVQNPEDPGEAAAVRIAELVRQNNKLGQWTNLGLPTDSTSAAMYAKLIKMDLDGSRVRTFHLDEYIGLPDGHPQQFKTKLQKAFFDHVNIPRENQHFLNGMAKDLHAEARRYERLIRDSGGLDFVILGIGENGHIAFVEPNSSQTHPKSETSVVTLAPSSRQANRRYFGGDMERVPRRALSMGIKTILSSKEILLLANSEKKAGAIHRALNEPISGETPASFLRLHQARNVTFIITRHAARPQTPILWRGKTVEELPDFEEFRHHPQHELAMYLYPGTKKPPQENLHQLLMDFLEAYRLLRKNGPLSNDELLQRLANEEYIPHALSPDLLNRGLAWLAIQGFPLRFIQGRWVVNGLSRDLFFVMDRKSWPVDLQRLWRAAESANEDTVSRRVGKRIRVLIALIQRLHGISWKELRRQYPKFSPSSEEAWRWASGQNLALDSSVAERAWAFGVSTEWLWYGFSRFGHLHPEAQRELTAPRMKPGKRFQILRRRAGLTRVDVLSELEKKGLFWNELSLQQFEEGVRSKILNPELWPALGAIVGYNGLLILTGYLSPRFAFNNRYSKQRKKEIARWALGYKDHTQTTEHKENVRMLWQEKRWPQTGAAYSPMRRRKSIARAA